MGASLKINSSIVLQLRFFTLKIVILRVWAIKLKVINRRYITSSEVYAHMVMLPDLKAAIQIRCHMRRK